MHPRKLLRLGRDGARRVAAAARVVGLTVGLALGLTACGGSAPPPPPQRQVAAEVRREIEAAERAELARDHFGARRHYEAAVATAVSSADPAAMRWARREFAETLISWGELGEAAAQLEQLVATAPEDAAAWHDLGMVRHGAGDLPGAVAALQRSKALLPRDARPRIALAALQWRRGDKAAALVEYRALLELDLPERVRDKVRWAIGQLEARH